MQLPKIASSSNKTCDLASKQKQVVASPMKNTINICLNNTEEMGNR